LLPTGELLIAAHGGIAEERSPHAIVLKVGDQAPAAAKLPTEADLNTMAQRYFNQQGSGDKASWDLAFENGYVDGFKKTHRVPRTTGNLSLATKAALLHTTRRMRQILNDVPCVKV
jgi:hypothetical protein